MLPIVHARALELGVVEFEAEWLNEVERGMGGGAEAGDIAGVWRNFGFEQDDMH